MKALLSIPLLLIAVTSPVLAQENVKISNLLNAAGTAFKAGTTDRGCKALRQAQMYSSQPNIYGETSEQQKAQIQQYSQQYGSICHFKL